MTVWVMVLMMSGTGKAAVVMPFEYETREQCQEAARGAGRDMPNWVCISGPAIKDTKGE